MRGGRRLPGSGGRRYCGSGGPPGCGSPARPRCVGPVAVAARLHPLGLAALLGEVRRPRRVAEAFGLVAVGERVQRVEPPYVRVDVGGRVADRGQAFGHGVQAQLAGSTSATSSQPSGQETRASGVGRTE